MTEDTVDISNIKDLKKARDGSDFLKSHIIIAKVPKVEDKEEEQ